MYIIWKIYSTADFIFLQVGIPCSKYLYNPRIREEWSPNFITSSSCFNCCGQIEDQSLTDGNVAKFWLSWNHWWNQTFNQQKHHCSQKLVFNIQRKVNYHVNCHYHSRNILTMNFRCSINKVLLQNICFFARS